MSEMGFEQYMEDSGREQITGGARPVAAVAENVLKAATKHDDEQEGFLYALLQEARIRLHTRFRMRYLNRISR